MNDSNDSPVKDETQLYAAVSDLTADEIVRRVQRNAPATGLEVTDEHLAVIDRLIEHYRETCRYQDCHPASPHMRFLAKAFDAQGGSGYLYKLFDTPDAGDGRTQNLGVLTLIHRLLELPDLSYNEDAGFGTAL